MKNPVLPKLRASFIAGLLVILPAGLSLLLAIWIFRNITSITDTLLVFVPKTWTHQDQGAGPLQWYFSALALAIAVGLITAIGHFAKNYIGEKVLQFTDDFMLRLPLVNKIYSTIKQVNEAFSGQKASFKQVVLLEYPRSGIYSIGFLTNDQPDIKVPAVARLVSVFVPTTPNPTSGFIVLVPETALIKSFLTVQEAIKFVISLGSLSPDQQQAELQKQSQPDHG
jgi:uncharacterized membrane protein